MKLKFLIILFSLSASFLAQAQAITDPTLLKAFDEIKELGPNLNFEVISGTSTLFAKIHETTEKGQLNSVIDIRYGAASKNLLDVYSPEGAIGTRPAVVFIHGGGLTGGDKDSSVTDLMYANVATFFARHNMVGINATYRLVPNIVYPQGAEDMKAIVAWIRDNAEEYGINPEEIFFVCASAGCTHVASLLFDQEMQFEGDPDIAGAIMLSGAFQADNEDYFGRNPEHREPLAAFSLAYEYTGEDVPVFLMSAEYDPNGIEMGTARLYSILCKKRVVCPRFVQARDHNHMSINQHINTQDERYTDMMLEFIDDVIKAE